jgi:ribonuclease E
MKKEMLINVLQPEECRIAIVEDGILEELYVERTSHESYTGNIYKGKVVNLEPAIQAAFVDFSVGRNGFLHVSDVEPQYYRRHLADDAESTPRDRDREREPRPRDDRRRPPRGPAAAGEERDLPPPPSYPEERIVRDRPEKPERDRPDRSERGRRDRSEPRRFGEGLVGDEDDWTKPAPPRPTPPTRPEADPFEPEEPIRRLRSEVAPPRPVEPPPSSFARTLDRAEPPRPAEVDEPRARGFGTGVGRTGEPEPVDPDLPPSRTQRHRASSPRPVSPVDEAPRARAVPPTPPPAREPEPATEGEAPAAREPRRARGRGRGRAASPEPVAGVDPELLQPEPFETEPEVPFAEEAPRRRGGRDAIRSRGGEREALPERPRTAAIPDRPAPPERARGFAAELTESDRPAPAPPARSERPAPPERPRNFASELLEPERPRPVVEPTRPRPTEPEPPRERERGRGNDRPRAAEVETTRERTKAHDRAGEQGYVPRRLRSGEVAEPVEAQIPPWGGLDQAIPAAPDIEEAEAEGDEFDPASGKDGPRRRRRRRGRRRDREPGDPPTAAAGPAGAELDDVDLEPHEEPEDAEIHASATEEIPSTSDFDFGDEGSEHDFDDEDDEDDDDRTPSSRVSDPDDQIDPELEEEIRKEIEEIAELEREMGLRGTVEARPRRGGPGAGPDKGPKGRGMIKPPLQEIFRRGDEVLVQVIKESIGTKGPTLSTYISIPGRYLVLMPGLNRVGVSRKIADEGQRRKLREIMNELNPPKGLGFIVRTAGLDRSKRDLARDLAYLLRLWKVILRRIKKAKTPAPIYQESDMITRTIRDIFNAEIDTIWIDEPAAFERAQEFLRVVMPRFVNRLKLYEEKVPIFHKYGIEDEIAKIQRRRVDLPEGGSIVIDQTEALVAIDVNSGNFRVENDAERTAYEMNLRAAKEIARQLRLRDLGGVIVNDFIDMRDERNRRGVEKALRDAIKRDRARTKVLRMSAFGLIEMTRQRIRPSLKRSVYEDCTRCVGAGLVKTVESMSIDVMRILALASHREDIRRVHIGVSPGVAAHLNNRKRKEITQIELDANMTVHIRNEEDAPAEHLQIDCFDANNNEIRLFPPPEPVRHHRPHRH